MNRKITGWVCLAAGIITIGFDLTFSEGHTATGLSLLAVIVTLVGLALALVKRRRRAAR